MSLEVRNKRDPYTVFAEAHYNIGRDMEFLLYLSGFFLVLAFLIVFSLGIMIFMITRSNSS